MHIIACIYVHAFACMHFGGSQIFVGSAIVGAVWTQGALRDALVAERACMQMHACMSCGCLCVLCLSWLVVASCARMHASLFCLGLHALFACSLQNVKFIQEKRLIGRFFDEVAQDTGKYVFGITETLQALEMGAIDTLIVYEALDTLR